MYNTFFFWSYNLSIGWHSEINSNCVVYDFMFVRTIVKVYTQTFPVVTLSLSNSRWLSQCLEVFVYVGAVYESVAA